MTQQEQDIDAARRRLEALGYPGLARVLASLENLRGASDLEAERTAGRDVLLQLLGLARSVLDEREAATRQLGEPPEGSREHQVHHALLTAIADQRRAFEGLSTYLQGGDPKLLDEAEAAFARSSKAARAMQQAGSR